MKRLEYATNQSNPQLQGNQGIGEWDSFEGFEVDPTGAAEAAAAQEAWANRNQGILPSEDNPQGSLGPMPGEYASQGKNVAREGKTFGQFAKSANLKYKDAEGKWREILARHGGIDNPGLKEYAPIDELVASYGSKMPPGLADKWKNSPERQQLVDYAEWWPQRNKGSTLKSLLPIISILLPIITGGLGAFFAPAAAGAGAAGAGAAGAGIGEAAALGAGVDAFGAAVPAGFAVSAGSSALPAAFGAGLGGAASAGGFGTLGNLGQSLSTIFPEAGGSSLFAGGEALAGPGLDLAAGGAMDMGIGFGADTAAQLGLNSGATLASSVGGFSNLSELMSTLKGLYSSYDKLPGVNKALIRMLMRKGMEELNSQPKPPTFTRR